MYDINLRAMHTMILSIRGVTIPIYLVSRATDSIRRRVVLFKPVPVPASDPKSEFLCQSSLSCAEPSDPLNTSYAWDISHALVTTYHPYCHSVTIGLHSSRRCVGLPSFLSPLSHHRSPVRYDLVTLYDTMRSQTCGDCYMYDTILLRLSCTISISEPPLL